MPPQLPLFTPLSLSLSKAVHTCCRVGHHHVLPFAIVFFPLLSACSPDPDQMHIAAKVASPDRKHVAIYAEDLSGGVTVGTVVNVYVVASGLAAEGRDRVFFKERVCHLQLHWRSAKMLEISYFARDAKRDGDRKWRGLRISSHWLGRDPASGC